MTEERNCGTCKYGGGIFCKSDDDPCTNFITLPQWKPKNPQPIHKAPSFQVTEEEARKILEVATILRNRGDMEIWIGNLKDAGHIRKSELVELVEEAEWMYENYRSEDYCITIVEALKKNHDALQALKKDHPEFGGKK